MRAKGTYFLETAEGHVKTRKESERARGTHRLDIIEDGTSQDRKWTRE
jgi:hypothetical protein